MAESANSIAELVAYLGLAIDESAWNEGLELLEKARKGVEKVSEEKTNAHKKEKKEHGELKETLEEGLETFFGYEGVKSIQEMVEHTMEATIEAKHLGERLGITTEAVQGLGYAADVTGASSATMVSALQRLSFNLNQTGLRTAFAQNAFSKLGLSLSEMKKLPLSDQLGEIAEKFKEMPDGPQKVALAMQLFGRTAGPQLVPLLNEGKEGIKELREEAEKLGVTTSEENVEKAEKLERAQKRLQARWGAMKDALVFSLIPALEMLTNGMSKVVDFLREHGDVVIAILAGIAAAIGYIGYQAAITHAALLLEFAGIIGPIMLAVYAVEALVDVFEHGFQPVKVILMTLALLVLGFIAPWYAVAAAVAAAAIIIYKHWSEIRDFFVDLWHDVVDTFENSSTAIKAAIFVAFLPISMTIVAIQALIDKWQDLKDTVGVVFGGVGVEDFMAGKLPGQTPEREDTASSAAATSSGDEGAKTQITQHNNVTIHTGATQKDVEKALDNHFSKRMSEAHHDLKRGG